MNAYDVKISFDFKPPDYTDAQTFGVLAGKDDAASVVQKSLLGMQPQTERPGRFTLSARAVIEAPDEETARKIAERFNLVVNHTRDTTTRPRVGPPELQ